MFDSAHNRIQFNFVGGVLALRAGKGFREKADGVLQASVFKSLFEHRSEGDTAPSVSKRVINLNFNSSPEGRN